MVTTRVHAEVHQPGNGSAPSPRAGLAGIEIESLVHLDTSPRVWLGINPRPSVMRLTILETITGNHLVMAGTT